MNRTAEGNLPHNIHGDKMEDQLPDPPPIAELIRQNKIRLISIQYIRELFICR